MRITIRYTAQLKAAAGAASHSLEVSENARIKDVVRQAAAVGTDELNRMLIDNEGAVHPTLLLFVGDECISRDDQRPLREGDLVAIMSPISGG